MKVTVTQVETLTLQLNRDEAIALGQILRQSNKTHKFGDIRDKTRSSLIENIEQGLEVNL